MKKFASLLIAVGIVASPARAGESDVTKVQMRAERGGTYSFAVTLRHAGWDHYANRWEVLSMDGKVLATRTLLHSHVNE